MGNQACSVKKACTVHSGENTLVTGTPDYDMRPPNITRTPSAVHMLICANDYKKTNNPLTSTRDGKNMEAMAKACGVHDLILLYDDACTKTAVKTEIRKMGRRCGENDIFVFYYSGHGTEVPDDDGDEQDGQDEAFCLVNTAGQVTRSSLMTDDEFVDLLLQAVPEQVSVLTLVDCCHSGTILDLDKPGWSGRNAVAVVGCTDAQTSADIGLGGVFTHSMLLAMEKLGQDDHYSIGKLYNTAVKENERVFNGAQSISIHCSAKTTPNQQAWPFVPKARYESPLRSAKNAGWKLEARKAAAGGHTRDVDIGDYKGDNAVPDDLAQWAKDNDIDLGSDYEDEELENGWKAGKALLDRMP